MQSQADRNAYKRAWAKAHPESIKRTTQQKYLRHKKVVTERNLEWRKANPERWREYCRKFYAENPEKWQTYRKKFYETNRGKLITGQMRRQERLRGPSWLTAADWAEIEGIYLFCRIFPQFEVDHIIPLNGKRVSGLHVPSNLQPMLIPLNRAKLNKFEDNAYGN